MNKALFKMIAISIGLAAILTISGCILINPPQTQAVHIPDPYRENPRIVFRPIDTSGNRSAVSIKQFSYNSNNEQQADPLSDADLTKVSFRQAYGASINNSFNGLQGTNSNNNVDAPNTFSVSGLTIPTNPPPPGLIKALGNSVTQPLPLPPNHQERMRKMLQRPIQAGPSLSTNISQQSN